MIGMLRGPLVQKHATAVMVDVGGVGYEVHCPLTVLDRLPPEGREATLSIHTHVREDQITLFGFTDARERALFRLLISVSGIGPKLALACLSGLTGEELGRAVMSEDVRRLSSIPGIGKRTAERLVLELSDKLKKQGYGAGADDTPDAATASGVQLDDLESALVNLGYRQKDVQKLIGELAPKAGAMSFEDMLREALGRLAR